MLHKKAKRHMSDARFDVWFEAFKRPYTQTKFIRSYKALENTYSELVIKHLLNRAQKRKVHKFLLGLPKMGSRRFYAFLKRFRKDPTLIHHYSYKDFTRKQNMIVYYYMLQYSVKNII